MPVPVPEQTVRVNLRRFIGRPVRKAQPVSQGDHGIGRRRSVDQTGVVGRGGRVHELGVLLRVVGRVQWKPMDVTRSCRSGDDPFWTAEPEPLPIEQEDIHQVFPEPGWIVTGTAASGNIHRFPLHTSYYPEKYAKVVDSTAAPYNAGLVHGSPAPDAMIALTDGLRFSHRTTNESAEIHPDGWLRYRHRHSLDGITALFETVIIPDGDLHLRIHRLVSSSVEGPVDIVEGAGALGFDDGEHPELVIDRELGISGGASLQSVVAMRCWDTREAALPRSFGNGNENIVFGNNVIPHVGGTMAEGDVAISTVFLGTPAQRAETSLASLLGDRPEITWSGDHVTVSWRGKRFAILSVSYT